MSPLTEIKNGISAISLMVGLILGMTIAQFVTDVRGGKPLTRNDAFTCWPLRPPENAPADYIPDFRCRWEPNP